MYWCDLSSVCEVHSAAVVPIHRNVILKNTGIPWPLINCQVSPKNGSWELSITSLFRLFHYFWFISCVPFSASTAPEFFGIFPKIFAQKSGKNGRVWKHQSFKSSSYRGATKKSLKMSDKAFWISTAKMYSHVSLFGISTKFCKCL